jgi:hypothetical protein
VALGQIPNSFNLEVVDPFLPPPPFLFIAASARLQVPHTRVRTPPYESRVSTQGFMKLQVKLKVSQVERACSAVYLGRIHVHYCICRVRLLVKSAELHSSFHS